MGEVRWRCPCCKKIREGDSKLVLKICTGCQESMYIIDEVVEDE